MVDEKKVNQIVDRGNAVSGGAGSSAAAMSTAAGSGASVAGASVAGASVAGAGSGDAAAHALGADTPGYELPLLLLAGFRSLIDRLHAELARQGHPGLRPAHGFALQAIGPEGATASEIGRRLGVSKQAAGKTVDRLEALGYAERTTDPTDARRKSVRITPHGLDALARSAALFDDLRADWIRTLGPTAVADMETSLRRVVPPDAFRLDASSWFGGA